jgi:hypothetical protein
MRSRLATPATLLFMGCSIPVLNTHAARACLTDSEGSSREVSFAQRLLQGADSTTLAARGFPFATAPNITLVTHDSTCAAALDAFNAHLPPASPDRAQRAYVVRLSGNGYMVVVPSDKYGEFLRRHIFNATWARVIAIAG